MVSTQREVQAEALQAELDWLEQVIGYRLSAYFGQPVSVAGLYDIAPPSCAEGNALYQVFVREHQLSFSERLILILAFAPYLRPQALDVFFLQNGDTNRVFTEFGGVKSAASGFMPTIETALFLLAGTDLSARIEGLEFFYEDRTLVQSGTLLIIQQEPAELFNNRAIAITPVFQRLFSSGQGKASAPDPSFPARRVETLLDRSDLVLPQSTMRQLDEVVQWIRHKDELLYTWNMQKFIRPGYVALFHGPPGTGKTLSASIIGKQCQMDVYRIDLSMVMSKYIGETEKNLAGIFDRAERKQWILFFDEADALFGKRTKVEDAHDRYANQEVSYLLQRIEEFPGVVILASNLKANIDDAFLRRIQSVIYFPVPGAGERYSLWNQVFTTYNRLHADVDMEVLAEKYTLTGGTIVNVARYAALRAISQPEYQEVTRDMIEEGIRRELNKEGKSMS